MSPFEKKLAKLQKQKPSQQRTVVLITTLVIFIPLMGLLIHFGAFSLSAGEQTDNSSVKEVVSRDIEPIAETLDKIGSQFIASTTQSLNEIREMASTTGQTVVENGTSSTSTLQQNQASTTAATTSGDLTNGQDSEE